jgi:type I restriction enzyme S subunit
MNESSLVQNISLLNKLPKTWFIKDFSDVVSDNSGGNKKLAKTEFLESGDIAIVDQGKELIAGYYDNINFTVKTKPPYIVFGDHTRIFKFIDFPFVMGADGTKVLQPKDNNCNTKYLYYFFLSINIPETGYNRHFKYLKELQIPLPPLEQQKKIAAILDAADAYRQKTKALIAKYDELTQSLFLDMFGDPVKNEKGWEIKTINDVCSIQGGYSFKSKDFIPETEKTIKVVKITNVHFEDLVWGEVDCLPNYYLEKYSNFSLNEGDILLALTRPIIKSLGTVKAITVKSIDLPCLLNQRVARIVPNEKLINKSFLLRFIFGDNFKNKIEKFSSTSLQPNVSNKQIEGIEIMLPPLLLQNQFSERVQAIEEQKAQAQASLEKAEELFNSLLQKAFKGELV